MLQRKADEVSSVYCHKVSLWGLLLLVGLLSACHARPTATPLAPATATLPPPAPTLPTRTPFPTPVLGIQDGGFLSGDPCGPPCFWGIVPGETREAEVLAILQERGVYDACRAWDNEAESAGRGISCVSGRTGFMVSFGQGEDIVDVVGLGPSVNMTVQDVVARYGAPAGINFITQGIHVYKSSLTLNYPDMFTRVDLVFQDNVFPYVLEPTTLVRNIGYFSPSVYSWSIERYESVIGPWTLQDWRGYGEYWPFDPDSLEVGAP